MGRKRYSLHAVDWVKMGLKLTEHLIFDQLLSTLKGFMVSRLITFCVGQKETPECCVFKTGNVPQTASLPIDG